MKLQLAQVPTKEQIKATLEQHLPQFKYAYRANKVVDCQQTFFVGATVVPRKDGVVINSNFPSMGASLFFTLFMLATGILIGLLLWVLVWKGSQDKVRDQVARVLGQVFGAQGAQAMPPGQPMQQPQMQQPQMQQPQMQQPPHMQQPQMQQPPHMQQPQMQPPQHMQQPQQPQQAQHQQGFAPGMQVFVAPGDGQRYPATIMSAANGQYQCMMPNGQPYWFPAQSVSAS